MVDTRFHSFSGPAPLAALLAALGLAAEGLKGDGPVIEGAEELVLAGPGHISLAAHAGYREMLRGTAAGAVIVSQDLGADVPAGTIAILAKNPHVAFADLLDRLYPGNTRSTVMALLGPRDALPLTEIDVRLGPGVVLGPGVEIGRGTVIGPNSVIGAGVTIGRNAVIGANVSIECAHLGNQVVLHAGARIGSEGFGWLDHGRSNRKIPQLGRVIIQDRVEVGANSTIDRGAIRDTVIGEGTKIDNLVQIAHNVQIGRRCVFAAQTGISGSCVVGDHVMMGGQVGIADNVTIGDGAAIAAQSGVAASLAGGGRYAGSPAIPAREWMKGASTLRRLAQRGGLIFAKFDNGGEE